MPFQPEPHCAQDETQALTCTMRLRGMNPPVPRLAQLSDTRHLFWSALARCARGTPGSPVAVLAWWPSRPMSQAASPSVRPALELNTPILAVSGLRKHFPVRGGLFGGVVNHVRAVEDVAFEIERGETLASWGESGCGKTTVGRMVLRLLEPTAAACVSPVAIWRRSVDPSFGKLRRRMQIVFQDPYSSLNPRRTVGDAIGEPLFVHGLAKGAELDRKVSQLLERVVYRVATAAVIRMSFLVGSGSACALLGRSHSSPSSSSATRRCPRSISRFKPKFSIFSAIYKTNWGSLICSLATTSTSCASSPIALRVMYLGKLVEVAAADDLFRAPQHPYTRALISANPVPDPDVPLRPVLLKVNCPHRSIHPPAAAFTPAVPKRSRRAAAWCPRRDSSERGPAKSTASGATCITMLRSLLSAFLVFAAALLVVGFTLSTSTQRRADFRFTNGTEPKTLDPQLAPVNPNTAS